MNGSIRERIIKSGKNNRGKVVHNLKVYDVYYRYTDPSTGRMKQTSKKGFRTKGEAEDFILKINVQLTENNYVQPHKFSLREYLNEWINTYVITNLRASSIAGYKVNIEKHIIPHLGNVELQNLTALHVENFYAQKQINGRLDGKGGLSPKSILYIHRCLHEALEHAVRKKLITRNVTKDITNLPKVKKYKNDIYNSREIKELLVAVKDTDMELPIALAALVGLRRGEILGLKEFDILFESQTIRICRQLIHTKDGLVLEEPKSEDSNRIINPPIEVMEIIKRHLERQLENKRLLGREYYDEGFVNCYPDGRPIDPRNFSKAFAYLLKKKGFKHIRFHDLRHSCATHMLNAGVPLKVASQILGHSTIGITADLYTHVITDMKKEAANKISNEIFGKDE